MQCGRQRPRLRSVDDDLHEPHRIGVRPQPAACLTGERIAACDPSLIAIPVKHADTLDPAVRGGDEPLSQPRALGQVVVVDTRVIGLDIVPSRRLPHRDRP